MADPPKPPEYPKEFRCRICGETRPVVRDWQRCWPCALASQTDGTVTLPGICQACHVEKHEK